MQFFSRRFWSTCCLLCLCITALQGQEAAYGRDFNFTILPIDNFAENPSVIISVMPADTTQRGTVNIVASGVNQTAFLDFDGSLLGAGIAFDAQEFSFLAQGKDDYVVRISSDIDILVYATHFFFSNSQNHGDGSLILPNHLLGTEYYVMSHNERPVDFLSQASVVATEDSTYVDIIPSADTWSIPAGTVETVMLNRGERYMMQSQGDLTGTYIGLNQSLNTECKPFAVFSGSPRGTVGSRTYAGHQYAQLYPTRFWDQSYPLLPFEQNGNEYLFKVLALEDDTRVSFNDNAQVVVLQAGESRAFTRSQPVRVEASAPVQVAQFFTGLASSGNQVDPFMLMPLSDNQMAFQEYSFFPSYIMGDFGAADITSHSLIVQTPYLDDYTHSSGNFQPNIQPLFPDDELSYAIFELGTPTSTLDVTNNRGFIWYSHLFSDDASKINVGIKANSGFTQRDDLNMEVNGSISVDDIACLGEPLNFRPVFFGRDGLRPTYDTFEWDFGDGNTANGDSVFYEYSQPGDYTVWLRAGSSTDLCVEERTVSRMLSISGTQLSELVGPQSVCPNLEGVTYRTDGNDQAQYTWSISGGTLVANNGPEVIVNWGSTNANASLAVVAETDNGCVSDTVRLSVRINRQLEPGLPQGNEEICFTDRNGQVYEVPPTPGSVYTWRITGGELVSGQGSPQVVVDWDDPGNTAQTGTLWFTESTTTQTDVCDGDSPVLSIIIHPELRFESGVTNVSCFGESDGIANLTIVGGKAPYTLTWPDNDNRLSRNDLPAGTYEIVLNDSLDCEFRANVTITEPDELMADITVTDVTCNGNMDGSGTLSIVGGTTPYRVSWNGGAFTNQLTSPPLAAGLQSVQVLDANDCEFLLNFEVTEPTALTASTTDTPSCPDEATGTIRIEAAGGTPPYTILWDTNPPQDTELAEALPAGLYSVTVTDANGCTLTLPQEEIRERQPFIRVPNAFTPNGDGQNDTFTAVFNCAVSFEMKIYSSWGEIIYYTRDINDGWDGTSKGEALPAGGYSYIITYATDLNGQPYTERLRGTVRLFR